MDKNIGIFNQKKSAVILMAIVVGLVLLTSPKNAKNSIGKCYIAFAKKEGSGILKVKEIRDGKYYGEITDSNTKETIKGVFSTKDINDLQPISCP